MVFIIIGDSDSKKNTGSPSGLASLKKAIHENKHVFLMIFSNGCPPCEATKPIWDRLKSTFTHNKDIVVARIVSSDFSKLQNAGSEPNGVPTFRYIHDKKVEEFSEGRLLDVFTNWIHSKCKTKKSATKKEGRTVKMRTKRGGGNDSTVIGRIVELTNDFMQASSFGTSIIETQHTHQTKPRLVMNLKSISEEATKLLDSSVFHKVRFTKETKAELVRLYGTLPASCKPEARDSSESGKECSIIDIYNAYAAIFERVAPVYVDIVEKKNKSFAGISPNMDYDFRSTYQSLNRIGFRFHEYSPQESPPQESPPPKLFQFIDKFRRFIKETNKGKELDIVDSADASVAGALETGLYEVSEFFDTTKTPNFSELHLLDERDEAVRIMDQATEIYNRRDLKNSEKYVQILLLIEPYMKLEDEEIWSVITSEQKSEFIETLNNVKPKSGGKRRKWSLKYKRSINCKRPRGFSQKQYCKRQGKKTMGRRRG